MSPRPIQAAALARLVEQTGRAIHSQGHSQGLFPAQWTALRYFAGAEPHLRSATALAAYQGMAYGPVSRSVRTLIAKGLVRKRPSGEHGRLELIELTEAGRALLANDPFSRVVAALETLSDPDRQVLAAALEAVLMQMQGADGEDGLAPEA